MTDGFQLYEILPYLDHHFEKSSNYNIDYEIALDYLNLAFENKVVIIANNDESLFGFRNDPGTHLCETLRSLGIQYRCDNFDNHSPIKKFSISFEGLDDDIIILSKDDYPLLKLASSIYTFDHKINGVDYSRPYNVVTALI